MRSQSKGIGSVDFRVNGLKNPYHEPIRMPRPIKPPFRRNVERLLRHNAMLSRAYSASV